MAEGGRNIRCCVYGLDYACVAIPLPVICCHLHDKALIFMILFSVFPFLSFFFSLSPFFSLFEVSKSNLNDFSLLPMYNLDS